MDERFKIYVDRLREGTRVTLSGTYSPDLFELDEKELTLQEPVRLTGEAYVAEEHLVLHFDATTSAKIPCSICNQWVEVPLVVKSFYETIPLTEIPDGLFDFHLPLREALLLELPPTTECKGRCPERETLAPYLRSQAKSSEKAHFPFSDL